MTVGKAADINYKLAEAMSEPNSREGFWHMTSLIHSLNPLECVSPITEGVNNFKALAERFPHTSDLPGYGLDIVLREGMCFQPEPNASMGRTRVNIGGNVVVTKTGCEELNQVCCEMRQV